MDTFLKLSAASCGVIVSYLFGGWSPLMNALLFFIAADFISGLIAAGFERTLSYKVGLLGIARKVFILFIVAISHFIDVILGDKNLIMSAVTFFYIANELISITENGDRLGLPIPSVLRSAIKAIGDKGGGRS